MGKRKREEEAEGVEEEEKQVKKSKKSKKSEAEEQSEPEVVEKKSKKKKSSKVDAEEEKIPEEGKTSPNVELVKSYEELLELVSVIAKPMASKKLTKKLYKVVKKSQSAKKLKRGVREVVKGLRKDVKGLVVMAGDISPIDVISHIPIFCEDKGIPYCYVPSRKELGAACMTRRPTSVVMVESADDYVTLYQECYNSVDSLPLPI